jgi:hypothetical protein
MNNGTTQQAIDLAKSRFAKNFPFDLSDETWRDLFIDHFPGDVLEAIKRTSKTRDPRPEKVYLSLLYWITRVESDRDEVAKPEWPPADVTPRN